MPKQSRDGICRLSRGRAFSGFPRRRDELCGRQARAVPVRERVDDTTVHQRPERRGAARLLGPVVEPAVVRVALREAARRDASERRRRGRRGNGDTLRERGRKVESPERVRADEAAARDECMTGQHDACPEQAQSSTDLRLNAAPVHTNDFRNYTEICELSCGCPDDMSLRLDRLPIIGTLASALQHARGPEPKAGPSTPVRAPRALLALEKQQRPPPQRCDHY